MDPLEYVWGYVWELGPPGWGFCLAVENTSRRPRLSDPAYPGWQILMVVSSIPHNRLEVSLCLGQGVESAALLRTQGGLAAWSPRIIDGMKDLQRHFLSLQFSFLSHLLVLSPTTFQSLLPQPLWLPELPRPMPPC